MILEQIKKLGATVKESKKEVFERLDEHVRKLLLIFFENQLNIVYSRPLR